MERTHFGNCPTNRICHCLVVDEVRFYLCCGYYHVECGGRVNEEKRFREALKSMKEKMS